MAEIGAGFGIGESSSHSRLVYCIRFRAQISLRTSRAYLFFPPWIIFLDRPGSDSFIISHSKGMKAENSKNVGSCGLFFTVYQQLTCHLMPKCYFLISFGNLFFPSWWCIAFSLIFFFVIIKICCWKCFLINFYFFKFWHQFGVHYLPIARTLTNTTIYLWTTAIKR